MPSNGTHRISDVSTPPWRIRSSSSRPTSLRTTAVTTAARRPKQRRRPRATLYSPPPSQTRNWRVVRILPSPGSRRSMTSPRDRMSNAQASFGLSSRLDKLALPSPLHVEPRRLERSGRSADDQLRIQEDTHPGVVGSTFDGCDELVGRQSRHRPHRPADRGERRPDPRRQRTVVESRHRQVPWHVQAHLRRGLDHSRGHVVVAGEDGRRRLGIRQQRPGALDPRFERIRPPRDHLLAERASEPLQRVAEALEPLARRSPADRPGDVADPPVPELDQVFGHRGHRRPLVGDHDTIRGVERDGRQPHVGDLLLGERAEQVVVLGERRQHDHAVQLRSLDGADHLAGQRVGLAAGMDDELVPELAADVQHATLRLVDEESVRIVVDQTQQIGAPAGEAASLRVRPVAQLVDDPLDLLAGRLAHLRRPVDHPGDGPVRDARQLGDVADRRWLACSRRSLRPHQRFQRTPRKYWRPE